MLRNQARTLVIGILLGAAHGWYGKKFILALTLTTFGRLLFWAAKQKEPHN